MWSVLIWVIHLKKLSLISATSSDFPSSLSIPRCIPSLWRPFILLSCPFSTYRPSSIYPSTLLFPIFPVPCISLLCLPLHFISPFSYSMISSSRSRNFHLPWSVILDLPPPSIFLPISCTSSLSFILHLFIPPPLFFLARLFLKSFLLSLLSTLSPLSLTLYHPYSIFPVLPQVSLS